MPDTPEARHARRVVTVPGWWSTVHEAERAAIRAVPRDDMVGACTHALDGIAVATVELMPGVPNPWASHESPPGRIGHLAEIAHENRWSGRAFVFEGQTNLEERMTARRIVDATAIDAVVLPGASGECDPNVLVVDAWHARPVYRDGRLLLTVRPMGAGTVTPFERRPPESAPHLRTTV